jgi:hypothetical protein
LAQSRDKPTVLIAWSPEDASSIATVTRFEKSLPKDTQIVYLAMGGTSVQVKKVSDNPPLPGIHCHAPSGPLSRSATQGLKLSYSPIPRVYVLNRAGLLTGFGRIEDLPALMAKVSG